MKRRFVHFIAISSIFCSLYAYADIWEPPAGYYQSASGGGTVLKSQLASIMSSGHIQRNYGDFRYSAAITDQVPNNLNNLFLCYTGSSVRSAWDSGATWNREHVWPESRQPGSVSNSSKGNLGDPHSLRPCNPSVNSSRSNKPFSGADLTGSYRHNGSYYFPGDFDKGNIARSLFYSSVRYNMTLVNGFPGGYDMGDLASLLRWHYMDPPDTFERRRNHTIYSRDYNPSYYTGNRNAFIDHPEYAWSVLGGDDNDTLLYVGSSFNSDGSSEITVELGAVSIYSERLFADVPIVLHKTGNDGTYFKIITSENAICEGVPEGYAFDYGEQNITLNINIKNIPAQPGRYIDMITIDNLDVCGNSPAGRGSRDSNDVIIVTYTVLAADLTDDGHVNIDDLLTLADNWLQVVPELNIADGVYEEPGIINMVDFSILASEWGGI